MKASSTDTLVSANAAWKLYICKPPVTTTLAKDKAMD